jgi:hypothetical protein
MKIHFQQEIDPGSVFCLIVLIVVMGLAIYVCLTH